MDFASTRICFITAHLAAGFANYDERNRDFQTVHNLRFTRNRAIDDHDTVIWLGDFNYRIGLNNEGMNSVFSLPIACVMCRIPRIFVKQVPDHFKQSSSLQISSCSPIIRRAKAHQGWQSCCSLPK